VHFRLVRFDHLVQGGKAEVGIGHNIRPDGGAETFLGMPAVDPTRCNPQALRRLMIVKQTFRGMENVAFGETMIG
jgi:hypothetical protein